MANLLLQCWHFYASTLFSGGTKVDELFSLCTVSVCVMRSITSLNRASHSGHFSGPTPYEGLGFSMPLDETEFGSCPPN